MCKVNVAPTINNSRARTAPALLLSKHITGQICLLSAPFGLTQRAHSPSTHDGPDGVVNNDYVFASVNATWCWRQRLQAALDGIMPAAAALNECDAASIFVAHAPVPKPALACMQAVGRDGHDDLAYARHLHHG